MALIQDDLEAANQHLGQALQIANETLVSDKAKVKGLKVKSQVKAGGCQLQHNETLVSDKAKTKGLKAKSQVKAGGLPHNHNETLVRVKGLQVKTQVKAGAGIIKDPQPGSGD